MNSGIRESVICRTWRSITVVSSERLKVAVERDFPWHREQTVWTVVFFIVVIFSVEQLLNPFLWRECGCSRKNSNTFSG